MTINGTIVDIKTYDTNKGKVINLYIREDLPYSILFHAPLWQDLAEPIGCILEVNDIITASAYAMGTKKGQITLGEFNLIEVKRPATIEEKIIYDAQMVDPMESGDSDD